MPSIYAFREAPGKHQEQPDRTDDQAEVLYRPTQLLALLIKANGYDGFIYPSAMGPGKNVVLFDPANVEVQPVSYTRIKRVAYFAESVSDHDDVDEEGPYDYALRNV